MFRIFIFTILFILSHFTTLTYAELVKKTDPKTRLSGWKLTEGGLELELIQRLPIQTLAFFQARGFSREIANDIGNSCVFQSIGKNIYTQSADESISIHLADWRVKANGQLKPVKLKEAWDNEWSATQVNSPARIAFKWATFPTQQTFEPAGDYNWGMISFDLSPGTVFDLQVVWKEGKTLKQQWITSLQCPENLQEEK
jgi:hypothetical protein